MFNVLNYLEESAKNFPEKIAIKDDKKAYTYKEYITNAKLVGSRLSRVSEVRKPIVCFAQKNTDVLTAFMGIVYAGCFYTLVDPTFPVDRINQILNVLKPETVISYDSNMDKLKQAGYDGNVIDIEKLLDINSSMGATDENRLMEIRKNAVDTDPLYCNFTSGSTGVPKGVLICHRSVIDFIDNFTDVFKISNEDVIANQAPFDFDVSVKDIFSSMKTGATLVLIPKEFFMFPNSVIDMLDDNKVTTLIWAVSALTLLNRLHALKYKAPATINKIMFSGEMMPVKQLNQWRAYYPEAMFVNLYGPTEITCNCTYYIVDKEFNEDDKIPMGNAFANEKVFLLRDDGTLVDKFEEPGEVCVAGTALALGYYNNEEMTKKAFTLNPLNKAYPEIIYHTGDLAYKKNDGLYYFAGRKDFQIKHMGHRIELEEIESVLANVSVVDACCCFFDDVKNRVVAYYTGEGDRKQIIDEMKKKVPDYMIPNLFRKIDDMPLNKNGKTDRKQIRAMYDAK